MALKRGKFWLYLLIIWIVEGMVFYWMADPYNTEFAYLFQGFLLTLLSIAYIMVVMARLTDAGLTKWLVILAFIFPIATIIFGFLPSKQSNKVNINPYFTQNPPNPPMDSFNQ